jgi:branched-chain amino acid transport system permease protein
MATFLRAITDGVLEGGVYGLMAVGLTLIFGVLDIINIAQGIMVVLGAYLSYVLWTHLHIDVFVGLLITIPAMFILGVAIQYLFIRPLRGRERTSMSLLACYAVAIITEGILYQKFGSNYLSMNTYWTSPQATFKIFGYYLPYIYVLGFALAVLFVVTIYFILYRTQFGRSVRATMQDLTAARLIGIDVNRVAALTFGIGVAVTAVGGMMFGAVSGGFNPNSGYDLISRLLAIIILGGLGSIAGALAAAVFMITLESVVDVVWSPSWAIVVFYGALVLVLSIRPEGIFGRKEARAQ